ncbi:PucR-like helix-turn-helix protein [Nocardioides albertanoniae]|uniref:PucR-like helix-turn-helix protein n=1 Tax=Nocardioides albertanoniae TaxID=1175486 RepID=A0A543A2K1_9ACTN|nr:helix-turn-helix domain-containing protein [Nocardioides albertanoniae]TQL66812.1 PucR-like helix-turn-helix protein [Nocardioides albertanoniae]
MTQTQQSPGLPGSAVWILKSLESEVRPIAREVTRHLREDLPAETEGFADLIYTAVHGAISHFIDLGLGRSAPYIAIDDHFRKVGFRVAVLGEERALVDAGIDMATTELWDEVRRRAVENEVSAAALNALNEMMKSYVEHLSSQVRTGFEAGTEARDQDNDVARARLIDRMLSGASYDDIEMQATLGSWELPEKVTVMAVELTDGSRIPHDALPATALTRRREPTQVVICPPHDTTAVTKQLRAAAPKARIAVCWPVPPEDVPAAWRWANRALGLVNAKVIPAKPVINCLAHRTEIWLHAEPIMRRQLAQELLEPLLAESANSREILTETLLVWLETRESAPAIAAVLGVHPQTIRYRWKRINELFGESLRDPEFVTQLLLLLKASVPLWVAGDQSDFDRYQQQTGAIQP